jgi:ribosome biogenesis GTPase / thiamine phosphate phosphatase
MTSNDGRLPPPEDIAGQSDVLAALGWQPLFADQIKAEAASGSKPVRIVGAHRGTLHVMGDEVDLIIPGRPDVVVGDWLLLDPAEPDTSRLLEQKSLLKRRAPGLERRIQMIAANIDTAFIVSSCNQDFSIARLERYIAMAIEAGVTPVILLTKVDLCDDAGAYVEAAKEIEHLAPVIFLNAHEAAAEAILAEWCAPGQTVAFLGSSGVGKSTLANTLSGNQDIETQAIREDDAKGRHTTTRRHLHLLPSGCAILDTPGMRELQMTDAKDGVAAVFADLQALTEQCRFRDCQHASEPGCAIQEAVKLESVSQARVDRWQKLDHENRHNTAALTPGKLSNKATRKAEKSMRR